MSKLIQVGLTRKDLEDNPELREITSNLDIHAVCDDLDWSSFEDALPVAFWVLEDEDGDGYLDVYCAFDFRGVIYEVVQETSHVKSTDLSRLEDLLYRMSMELTFRSGIRHLAHVVIFEDGSGHFNGNDEEFAKFVAGDDIEVILLAGEDWLLKMCPEVGATGIYRVEMKSNEYGNDWFDYSTEEEALAGLSRLRKRATEFTIEDGVERTVIYVGYVEEE